MRHKWTLLFYLLQLAWCVWLIVFAWGQSERNPSWINVSGLLLALGLLAYWVWNIYRIFKPKKYKELGYTVKEDEDGNWWVGTDSPTNGPFTERSDAIGWIKLDIKREIKREIKLP